VAIDVVRLLGLGPLTALVAQELAPRLSRRLGAACRFESRTLGAPARIAGRDQLDADDLLARLESEPARPGTVIVGVTALDIAIPIFTFVFGRARTPGRAAVVSTARLEPSFYGLPPDPERALQRTLDEIRHELGHLVGLRHCQEPACLMRFAGSVAQVDVRGSVFCDECRSALPAGLG
jgi:archaemetzincin